MADNRNNPPKPNKDQKVNNLPPQKGNTSKDAQVKGGLGGRGRPKPFQEVDSGD